MQLILKSFYRKPRQQRETAIFKNNFFTKGKEEINAQNIINGFFYDYESQICMAYSEDVYNSMDLINRMDFTKSFYFSFIENNEVKYKIDLKQNGITLKTKWGVLENIFYIYLNEQEIFKYKYKIPWDYRIFEENEDADFFKWIKSQKINSK